MAFTTTNSGSVALPQATLTVVSTTATNFATPAGTLSVASSAGRQNISYTGTTGTTFTGCTGGTGNIVNGNQVTQSEDEGNSVEYRPTENLISLAIGVFGSPSQKGVSGAPKFNLSAYPNDYIGSAELGVSLDLVLGLVTGGGTSSTLTNFFLMRCYESGGSCSGNVPRIWVVTGTPDLTGTFYTGARCSPTPGTFSNFVILAKWSQ